MKNTFIALPAIFLLSICTTDAFCQPYDPEILILSPNNFTYEKQFRAEVDQGNKEYSSEINDTDIEEFLESPEFLSEPENIREMILSQLNFYRNMDLSKYATSFASIFLQYLFFEYLPAPLILPQEKSSGGDISELGSIAGEAGMQYVLNFPEIRLYKKGGESYADISVQLYDDLTKTLLINETFTGGSSNPGFEFSCEEGSLICTIHNALAGAIYTVFEEIMAASPIIQKERELAEERVEKLIRDHYYQPYDENFLETVISEKDTTISRSDMYQLLIDPSAEKFVAFFLNEGPAPKFGDTDDYDRDGGLITIISDRDFKEEGFFEDMPQTYAYMLKGIKYDGKWYYQKADQTYFKPADIEEGRKEYFSNLIDMDFFIEGSAMYNPGFWEGCLFPKVVSEVEANREQIERYEILIEGSSEDEEFYRSMIDGFYTSDEKNKEYIGMYEIVADHFKKERKQEYDTFAARLEKEVLDPFFTVYCRDNSIREYKKLLGKIIMIFPADRSVILCPIALGDGGDERELRFFVLLPAADADYSIYEWTYSDPTPTEGWHYGNYVVERLNDLTKWNFSYDTLEDRDFWEKYVLARSEDGGYIYLTPMN